MKELLGWLFGLAVTFVGFVLLVTWTTKQECYGIGDVTQRRVEWRVFGGCFIEHDGAMLPYDKWILLDVTVKERK